MLRPALLTRLAGAAALMAVGAEHLDQYAVAHYDAIPTIGTLFALNAAGAAVLALGLVAPVQRIGRRAGPLLVDALALGGMLLAGGSLVGLVVSERRGLFGFTEAGYHGAVLLSIVLEAATVALLAAFLALPRATSPTTVGRTCPRRPSRRRSMRSRPRSWTSSGLAGRPRSER